jgi:uncharacterized protein (DUF486 family)
MATIALLTISNIFMTFAWYGHLKYRSVPLFKVILLSWMIAFFEYCFQVPANRIASYEFNAAQWKTIQEVITLVVFSVFSVFYVQQSIRCNHIAGFGMIMSAVGIIFKTMIDQCQSGVKTFRSELCLYCDPFNKSTDC